MISAKILFIIVGFAVMSNSFVTEATHDKWASALSGVRGTEPTDDELLDMYMDFLVEHNKLDNDNYPALVAHRFPIFKDNVDYIRAHNGAGHTWEMGINKWADLTAEEFKKDAHLMELREE